MNSRLEDISAGWFDTGKNGHTLRAFASLQGDKTSNLSDRFSSGANE
ncbi:MAG: hypothetical protein Q7R50_07330 [Dehalococcoidales bacterium]|nr:hypothetical protein [Dehalococcoidales bacterium]